MGLVRRATPWSVRGFADDVVWCVPDIQACTRSAGRQRLDDAVREDGGRLPMGPFVEVDRLRMDVVVLVAIERRRRAITVLLNPFGQQVTELVQMDQCLLSHEWSIATLLSPKNVTPQGWGSPRQSSTVTPVLAHFDVGPHGGLTDRRQEA